MLMLMLMLMVVVVVVVVVVVAGHGQGALGRPRAFWLDPSQWGLGCADCVIHLFASVRRQMSLVSVVQSVG